MIITFAHTKGGVGKTTSTIGLAVAAHNAGYTVDVLDADRQGSAYQWAEIAERRGAPLPFPVERADAKAIERRSRKRDQSSLTIIDTPPGTAEEIQAAINAADLVIVPTGAAPMDIARVWPTLEFTRALPTVVLLTGVLINTRLYEATRELFGEENVPVFRTPIPQREKIKDWLGTTPTNLNGYNDILDEILGIIDDLEVSL
ncbi:nucleotide-binding protein [Corynebacterium sp. AOP12-C2-36]|uniref:nucleotide-binding protein n=1 Tax=Corynebacterium sp. AOP12-C2-36 TaxID=3457723 RepID=UPI0040342B9F